MTLQSLNSPNWVFLNYYDYGDIKYRGLRDVKNLFDLLINEDYYKPIKTNNSFNSNYI